MLAALRAAGSQAARASSRHMSTMPALFMHGARDVRYGELPTLEPQQEGKLLIDIEAVGICGSDLHYYKDGGIGAATIVEPFVPGHEFAARMVEDDEELGVQAGDLVAVDPAKPCGVCEWCKHAYHNLCPYVEFTGAPPINGALTSRIAVSRSQIFPVPQTFSVAETVMLEPLGVAIHAVDLAKPSMFESVCMVGCGPIGLKILQLLRLAGVTKIFAVDPLEYRSKVALEHGAAEYGTRMESVMEWSDGRGADLVIEATNSPMGFQNAAEAVRIGGRVVLVGIPDGNEYSLDASEIRRKGLNIKTSRRMGDVFDRAIDLVKNGQVDITGMITHNFQLQDGATAFSMQANYEDGMIKTLINI